MKEWWINPLSVYLSLRLFACLCAVRPPCLDLVKYKQTLTAGEDGGAAARHDGGRDLRFT